MDYLIVFEATIRSAAFSAAVTALVGLLCPPLSVTRGATLAVGVAILSTIFMGPLWIR